MLPPDLSRPIFCSNFCSALLLSACAAPPQPPAPPPPPPEVREVRVEVPVPVVLPEDEAARQMLAYHERLRRMDAAELARQAPPPGDDATLSPQAATQAALALSLAHANGEAARAQALVEQVLRSAAAEARHWQPWAQLIGARLAEQRRLEAQIERLAQQGRDSQRKIEQLSEKLEALKAIERSLTKRPPATGKPASLP